MRHAVITTVITAADSKDLVSLSDVKTELGLSGSADDAWLAAAISRASAAAAQYCNREFVSETVKDEFWPERDPYPFQVPGGLAPLQLTRWPVSEVATVTEAEQDMTDGTDFRADLKVGQLIRLDGSLYPTSWLPRPILVQYTAGFSTIPADVQDAVIRMVKARWFTRQRDPLLRQEDVPGVYSASYWVATGSEGGAITPDVADLLDNYRVPVAFA